MLDFTSELRGNSKRENRFSSRENNVSRLLNQFCDFCLLEKGYSPETIKCYEYSLGSLLKNFDIQDIQKINEGIIRQWFHRGRENRNWTNNTIRHHIKNLSPFFTWCFNQKILKENPLANIEKPKVEDRECEFFDERDIEKIMYAVHEYPYASDFLRFRNYAILSFLLLTGVRKKELLNLKLLDVDLENRKVKIRPEISKTRKGRIIPISQRLRDVLMSYLDKRQKLNKKTLIFFVSYRLDKGFTNSGLRRLFARLQRDTGIHIHTHKFRHTYGSIACQSGISLPDVRDNMGHSNIKTTSIYTHTNIKNRQKSNEKNEINLLI